MGFSLRMRCRSRAPTWASQAAALNTNSLPYCLQGNSMCELQTRDSGQEPALCSSKSGWKHCSSAIAA